MLLLLLLISVVEHYQTNIEYALFIGRLSKLMLNRLRRVLKLKNSNVISIRYRHMAKGLEVIPTRKVSMM